jgi:hypothetical protein
MTVHGAVLIPSVSEKRSRYGVENADIMWCTSGGRVAWYNLKRDEKMDLIQLLYSVM